MSRRPIQRVAFVRLTPQGKAYAMRCDREDLGVGDHVEVLMYAESAQSHWDSGVIEDVAYLPWDCSCHVKCHRDEMRIDIDATNGFQMRHTIDVSGGPRKTLGQIQQEKATAMVRHCPAQEGAEMRSLYHDLAPVDGDDVYLSDGVWLRPNGSFDDRGR
jgi:hypothetical protein